METKETNQEQSTQSNEPAESHEEISESVKEFVTRTANAAQSSHATRLQKTMDKKFQENNERLLSQIKELLGTRNEPIQATDGAPQAAQPTEMDKKVQAKLSQLEKALDEEKARVEQERSKAQRAEEKNKLAEALRSSSVSEERLRGAMALLYTEDQRIGRDASGNIVFKIQKDGYEDELPLNEGVAQWLESSEGKHYAAPKNVSGSGMTGGQAPRRGGKVNPIEQRREVMRNVMNRFLNGQ